MQCHTCWAPSRPTGFKGSVGLTTLMWLRGRLATSVVAAALCGCVHLPEVQKFAAKSAEGAAFQRILDDYQDAPERQARFLVPNDQATADAKALLDKNAAERKEQVKRAKLLLTTVSAYMV